METGSQEQGRQPPVHIPIPFEQAVEGLIRVRPKPDAAEKQPEKQAAAKKSARKTTRNKS